MEKDTLIAVIGSYTKAENARRILNQSAIFANIVKISDESGCTYGVEFPAVHKAYAVSALNAGRIFPKGFRR